LTKKSKNGFCDYPFFDGAGRALGHAALSLTILEAELKNSFFNTNFVPPHQKNDDGMRKDEANPRTSTRSVHGAEALLGKEGWSGVK
jgi:hypothetical protein